MSTVSAQREDSDSQDTSGRDSREEWREPDHGGFDPSQALAGIEPLFHVSNKWFANWMAVGSEIVEFSRASFDRNLEVTKAIATSGSFGKAMELQADHARSTVHEYFTEAGKLVELSTRAVLDGLLAWQPATHRTIADAEAAI
jgi:hypothetical protein